MKEIMEITQLREEVEAVRSKCRVQKGGGDDSDHFDDESEGRGLLVPLLKATKAWLETTF